MIIEGRIIRLFVGKNKKPIKSKDQRSDGKVYRSVITKGLLGRVLQTKIQKKFKLQATGLMLQASIPRSAISQSS
jgi:hypothetical protein